MNNEQRVIASLIQKSDLFDDVADILSTTDFYETLNQRIFADIQKMIITNHPVDFDNLLNFGSYQNHEAGYIAQIYNQLPTCANIIYFAEKVRDESLERQMKQALRASSDLLTSKDPGKIDAIQKLILEVGERRIDKGHLVRDFSMGILEAIQLRIDAKGQNLGYPTGYLDIDALTHGFYKSDLIILAARPSMGKTLLALNIAMNMALSQDEGVAFFSLEMTRDALGERLLSSHSRVENDKIKTGKLLATDINKLTESVSKLDQTKLIIDESSSLTTMQIRARARRIKRQHGLALIVVDYLTYLDGKGENETKKIGNLSRDLKRIAKELNVPVLVLSQLNRKLEERADKRPMLSDLRDSGEIEQDADMVFFIYRDEVYNSDTTNKGIAEIILAKNRNGSIGKVYLTFNGHINRFDNYTGEPIKEPSKVQPVYRDNSFKFDRNKFN